MSGRTEAAFRDVTLYHDPLHLNARGAELFSRKVAAKLEDRPGGRAAGRQVSPR